MHLRIQMFQASAEVKSLHKLKYCSICNTVRPFYTHNGKSGILSLSTLQLSKYRFRRQHKRRVLLEAVLAISQNIIAQQA